MLCFLLKHIDIFHWIEFYNVATLNKNLDQYWGEVSLSYVRFSLVPIYVLLCDSQGLLLWHLLETALWNTVWWKMKTNWRWSWPWGSGRTRLTQLWCTHAGPTTASWRYVFVPEDLKNTKFRFMFMSIFEKKKNQGKWLYSTLQ